MTTDVPARRPNARPWLKFLLAGLAAGGLLAVLALPLRFGESRLPRLGAFLNPYGGAYQSNDVDYYLDDERLPGLRAPVEIYYDERLVPHIYASSSADLFFAQGFVQAQHRLFQLDLTARSAEGRLSEVLGARTRDFDLLRRRIGGGPLADRIDSLWRLDPVAYEAVTRYAEGVNAYIASLEPRDYPIEYKLLDFSPEQWSPRSTALVAISMAYTLNFGNDDLAATQVRDRFGRAVYDFLFPDRSALDMPVIPAGTSFNGGDSALLDAIRASEELVPGELLLAPPTPLSGRQPAPAPPGIGSNNWAVAGTRTATGNPLLANDPHLGLTLPSIWFESELHAGDFGVHGVSLPGVPGITIGFNADCAWGVTNVGLDVVDWHEVRYTDPARTRYEVGDGTTAPIELRLERIRVRGEPDLVDTVRVTRWGPIAYTDTADARAGLAMAWLTLQRPSGSAVRSFLALNTAQTVADFLAASQQFEWPAQNMVFANRAGDIALRVSGTRPRDLPDEGRFVRRPGDPEAKGYLDPELNPFAVNPPQGYLASTNQVSTDATYPYPYRGIFEHHRSRRANQLLASAAGLTVEDLQAFQLDDYSTLAGDLVPVWLRLLRREGLPARALGLATLIEPWRYRFAAGDFAPVIFERWLEAIERLTWDEFDGWTRPGAARLPPQWRLAELLRADPDNAWFDIQATPAREDAAAIVTAALVQVAPALDSLRESGDYDWAVDNAPAVRHLARIPAFSRERLVTGGRAGTLDAQRGDVGPSWRMVVSLGDTVRATVVYPGGQSGRPGHPHYDDFVDEWAAGQYFAVRLHSRAEMEDADGGLFGRGASVRKVTLAP